MRRSAGLGVAALAGVIVQGVLGGMRVLANEVTLAQIHGCVGPAFFAFTVALAVVTSRRWHEADADELAGTGDDRTPGLVTTFLAMLQIVLGSQLRHLPAGARPGDFRLALFFHLFVAAGLWVHIAAAGACVSCRGFRHGAWMRPACDCVLSLLVLLQIVLGLGTWVTKYGFPGWMIGLRFRGAVIVPRPIASGRSAITTATSRSDR